MPIPTMLTEQYADERARLDEAMKSVGQGQYAGYATDRWGRPSRFSTNAPQVQSQVMRPPTTATATQTPIQMPSMPEATSVQRPSYSPEAVQRIAQRVAMDRDAARIAAIKAANPGAYLPSNVVGYTTEDKQRYIQGLESAKAQEAERVRQEQSAEKWRQFQMERERQKYVTPAEVKGQYGVKQAELKAESQMTIAEKKASQQKYDTDMKMKIAELNNAARSGDRALQYQTQKEIAQMITDRALDVQELRGQQAEEKIAAELKKANITSPSAKMAVIGKIIDKAMDNVPEGTDPIAYGSAMTNKLMRTFGLTEQGGVAPIAPVSPTAPTAPSSTATTPIAGARPSFTQEERDSAVSWAEAGAASTGAGIEDTIDAFSKNTNPESAFGSNETASQFSNDIVAVSALSGGDLNRDGVVDKAENEILELSRYVISGVGKTGQPLTEEQTKKIFERQRALRQQISVLPKKEEPK